MTRPSIVLVEDSERYIAELTALIAAKTCVAEEDIQIVRTEAEFYARLPHWEQSAPNVFAVDVMIPYKDVGEPDDHVPAEIRQQASEDKFYRAGIRCIRSLLAKEALRQLPIIIHSILVESDIKSDEKYPIPDAPNVTIIKKEANGHGVVDAIQKALSGHSPA